MYTHFGPTEHNFFSERGIGSELLFWKSSKTNMALLPSNHQD
jgi:hypothetical protein